MMTRTQFRDDLLAKLGQEVPASASTAEQTAVVTAANGALQLLWVAGASYFLREAVSITLVAGTAAYVLGATVQVVGGPVRMANGEALRRFDTRAQLDDYALEVGGESSRTVADGTPWGFLIEHNRAASGDIHAMTLRLQPAPNAAAVTACSPLTVDGVIECPSYSYSDLASGALPVPEGYVELYLLPLARSELTRSHIFSRRELIPLFQADAARAMQALGLADGQAEATGDTGKVGKQTKKGSTA
jgi:hypothetical protein